MRAEIQDTTDDTDRRPGGVATPPVPDLDALAEATAPATSPGDGTPTEDSSTDDRYQQRLGERLRSVRRAQGLRLQDVEIASDGRFKAVVVGSYERGDRAVSAHKLAALAEFYGVPVIELLPDDAQPRGSAREEGLRLAVDRLRAGDETPETAPLVRLVQHVQWLRGDYNGRVLSLRGDDLRTVAVALGVEPDQLGAWLEERGLLAT